MNNTGIKNISIKLDNKLEIIATPTMFENFYISNIDKHGDEIAFTSKENSNRLKANFFMIKLSNDIIEYNLTKNTLKENAFKVLKSENNITEVTINFKNGYSQPFMFTLNNDKYTQKINNDLCILLSEHKIKYKENLFV